MKISCRKAEESAVVRDEGGWWIVGREKAQRIIHTGPIALSSVSSRVFSMADSSGF